MKDSNKQIYIRVDGNQKIATGHIMRCLSIARSLSELGALVTFLVADSESEDLLCSRMEDSEQFPVFCLDSAYDSLEDELETLEIFLEKFPPDYLLIDSYFITSEYLKQLKNYTKIAYIDDLELLQDPLDMVIHYGVISTSDYSKVTHPLVGGLYTPLRKQFEQVSYLVKPTVETIFITTGGTDEYNVAGNLLEKFIHNPDFETTTFKVVSGSLNVHKSQLQALAAAHSNIQLFENVSDMAKLMASCDIAISAGGTTLCELCAVGIPSISYCIADNQLGAVANFHEKKIIQYAGDVRNNPQVFDEIMKIAGLLASHYDLRLEMSKAGVQYTDGKGASRIAAALIEFS